MDKDIRLSCVAESKRRGGSESKTLGLFLKKTVRSLSHQNTIAGKMLLGRSKFLENSYCFSIGEFI